MTSPWILEPETGRYYFPWTDENGRRVRRYSEELDAGPSSSDPSQTTPRYGSSRRSSHRNSYIASSSRHSSSRGQAHQDSELSERRPPPIPEHPLESDHNQPKKIYDKSRSKYYGNPEDDHHVESRSPPGPTVYGSPRDQTDFQPVSGEGSGGHDWQLDSRDVPTTQMCNLTVEETTGYNTNYAAVPSPTRTFDQSGLPVQWPTVVTGGYNQPLDKGKGIAQEQPEATRSNDPRYVAATEGYSEKLDPSYQVRNHDYLKFFRVGRIFSTLWTDPYGGATNDKNQTFQSSVSLIIYNEKVHSKVRRFVVVRQGDRCCLCLPVTTYDGKRHRKNGINLSEHGHIYSHKRPNKVHGMDKKPMKVILSKGATKLDDSSLINYGRVYTVETNVKVKDVGELDLESRRLLRTYFKEVITAEDDLGDGPFPERTPQNRVDELAGVGAGMGGTSQSYTPVPATYAPVVPTHAVQPAFQYSRASHTAGWANTSGYGSTYDSGAPSAATTQTGYSVPQNTAPSFYTTGNQYKISSTTSHPYALASPSIADPHHTTNDYSTPSTSHFSSRSPDPNAADTPEIPQLSRSQYPDNQYHAGQGHATVPTVSSGAAYASHGASRGSQYSTSTPSVETAPYRSGGDQLSPTGYIASHAESASDDEDIQLATYEEARSSSSRRETNSNSSRSYRKTRERDKDRQHRRL